jgi:hypothetical protein
LYATRFDWNTEKVLSFERVDLKHVISIRYGTYITSTLSPTQADPHKNVGFVVTYTAGTNDISRVNTRSMSTAVPREEELPTDTPTAQVLDGLSTLIAGKPAPPQNRVLAWKALPSRSAISKSGEESRLSEMESVKAICTQIERMVHHWQEVEAGTERTNIMEEGDIINFTDARKSTGILEQLGHSLKKLVWA